MKSSRALVITSHRNNSVALDTLRESLLGAERLIDIIVVIGGYAAYDIVRDHRVTTVYSPYNSIDFTGLLALLDMPSLQHDSYFYMHDTTRAGSTFVHKVLAIPEDTTTASFQWPSMNIGIYTHTILVKSKETLDSFRNTEESLAHIFKSKCVAFEDCIFRENKEQHLWLSTMHPDGHGDHPMDCYGSGVLRRVEYYPSMDMYKMKANWEIKDTYELRA
jgi:hypothetical protein